MNVSWIKMVFMVYTGTTKYYIAIGRRHRILKHLSVLSTPGKYIVAHGVKIFVTPGDRAHILKTRIIMYNPFNQQQSIPHL
jgi:hypothetical protein